MWSIPGPRFRFATGNYTRSSNLPIVEELKVSESETESKFVFLQVSIYYLLPHCLFPEAAKQYINK